MVVVRQVVLWMMALSIMNATQANVATNYRTEMMTPHIIFNGDSRTVGMQHTVTEDEDSVYVAESNQGYAWFVQNLDRVKASVTSNCVIIINFGVNDLVDAPHYVEKINELQKEVSCEVYFMSVNPVDDDILAGKGNGLRNFMIEEFNETMKSELGEDVGYIDSYAYLMQEGYETMDGLHYSADTYRKIHNYCTQQVSQTKVVKVK